MKHTKRIAAAAVALSAFTLAGCGVNDADVVNKNIEKAADNFEVFRRIVIFNNESDKVIQLVEGWCNAEIDPDVIRTTCRAPGGGYHRHLNGRNAHTGFSVQQLDAVNVSKDRYRVTFNPSVVIPDVDVR